jgi:hypothetical protein
MCIIGIYGCVVPAYDTLGFSLKCIYGLLPFARYYCIMEENVQEVKGQRHVYYTNQSKDGGYLRKCAEILC